MSNPKVIYEEHPESTWITPTWLRYLAREILQGIDLDPCTEPNNPMRARSFYTAAGLEQDWQAVLRGDLDRRYPDDRLSLQTHPTPPPGSLWMNPPYGREIGPWMERFFKSLQAVPASRGLALVPARVGARWYREATARASLVCELDGRLAFERLQADGTYAAGQPARWGAILIYVGPNRAHAARTLRAYGQVRFVGYYAPPTKRALRKRLIKPPAVDRQLSIHDWPPNVLSIGQKPRR